MVSNPISRVIDQEIHVFLSKGLDSATATIGKATEVRGIVKDSSTI